MPTKTEYREYIASEAWRDRRGKFLEQSKGMCELCDIPRWLAIVAYDQDLHVHHKSYLHVGAELDSELQALCRRCHEIKTFNYSNLHQPKKQICVSCKERTCWDVIGRQCDGCKAVVLMVMLDFSEKSLFNPSLCPNGEPINWIEGNMEYAQENREVIMGEDA